MNKKDIQAFFDKCASWWDDDMIRNEEVINQILDNAKVGENTSVLDVACGTGVLFPDYIKRHAQVVGIDISSEMVKIARKKFPDIDIICGDVETRVFDCQFDSIMVYNAFPHFGDPVFLIKKLSQLVKCGGRLSIAHGMSREALLKHHQRASRVSIELLEIEELAQLLEPYFEIEVMISDESMYQLVGRKR